MSDSAFYTDREGTSTPRVGETITADTWRGLVALIHGWIDDGSLARAYPLRDCPDGKAITGTDVDRFLDALCAYIPSIAGDPLDRHEPQDSATALDILDFIGRCIDMPTSTSTHMWNGEHTHYSYDERPFRRGRSRLTPGQSQFQDAVNLLFRRNGIAFTVGDDLQVQRLGPPEVRDLISDFRPDTGDHHLDQLLNDALTRFRSPRPADRQDAVEKLWHAFERLKTLEGGKDKKESAARLIERATDGYEPFYTHLEAEFRALSAIGNQFRIRHHEHDKGDLPGSSGLDYVFTRMAAAIGFVLRRTDRMD